MTSTENIFHTDFDLFEFDDNFLSKLDSVERKHNCNLEKNISKTSDRSFSTKNVANTLSENKCVSCISPILDKFSFQRQGVSFSTPKRIDNFTNSHSITKENLEEMKKNRNSVIKDEYGYIDLDLFEDWDTSNVLNNKCEEKNDFLTLSKAIALVEKFDELEEQKKKISNNGTSNSIDLLKQDVLRFEEKNSENFFDDSFELPDKDYSKSLFLKDQSETKNNMFDSIKITDPNLHISSISLTYKPFSAQKLNFDQEIEECHNLKNSLMCKEKTEFESYNSSIGSLVVKDCDNEFGSKELSCKNNWPRQRIESLTKNVFPLEENELSDDSLKFTRKRRKNYRTIDSDSDENIQIENLRKAKKISKFKSNREMEEEFFELEAEVSNEVDVSSDETEDEKDDFEKSFVDDNSYFTQNASADMTSKYLEAAKAANDNRGIFKIPVPKPYVVNEIFSQLPNEDTEYEMDSFCVNEVEYEQNELSALEIAEQVLEMEKKKKKRKKEKNTNYM